MNTIIQTSDLSRIDGQTLDVAALATGARTRQIETIGAEQARRDAEIRAQLAENTSRDLELLKPALQRLFGTIPACELTWHSEGIYPAAVKILLEDFEIEGVFNSYRNGGRIVGLYYNKVQIRDLAHLGELLEIEAQNAAAFED